MSINTSSRKRLDLLSLLVVFFFLVMFRLSRKAGHTEISARHAGFQLGVCLLSFGFIICIPLFYTPVPDIKILYFSIL
jgi:hypothetical protein